MKSNSCWSGDAAALRPCVFAPLRWCIHPKKPRRLPGWFMAAEVFISDFICALRLRRAPDHHSVWKSSIIFTAARLLFIKRMRYSMHVNQSWREKLRVEDVRCLLKCPGSRSVALVGRGNDRGTKEFMCKRWWCVFFFYFFFYFSWGHRVYCLSWEVRHTPKAPTGCFRCLCFCPGRAWFPLLALDPSLTVQER